jgi:uncharacterized membrane protein
MTPSGVTIRAFFNTRLSRDGSSNMGRPFLTFLTPLRLRSVTEE